MVVSVSIKIDNKNVFNTVKRNVLLQSVKEFLFSSYAHFSNLFYKKYQIFFLTKKLLGRAIFGFRIKPIFNNHTFKLNIWYLHDGTSANFCWQSFCRLLFFNKFKPPELLLNFSKNKLSFSRVYLDLLYKTVSISCPWHPKINNLRLLGSQLYENAFFFSLLDL